jgi:hypothetical protein
VLETTTFESTTQIVETYKHRVITAISYLMLDDNTSPVSIALRTFVFFVVEVTCTGH